MVFTFILTKTQGLTAHKRPYSSLDDPVLRLTGPQITTLDELLESRIDDFWIIDGGWTMDHHKIERKAYKWLHVVWVEISNTST